MLGDPHFLPRIRASRMAADSPQNQTVAPLDLETRITPRAIR